jgi:hypothetical protein
MKSKALILLLSLLASLAATAASFTAYLTDPRAPEAGLAIVRVDLPDGAANATIFTVWVGPQPDVLLLVSESDDVLYLWQPVWSGLTTVPANNWPSGDLTGLPVALLSQRGPAFYYGVFERDLPSPKRLSPPVTSAPTPNLQ